MWKKNVCRQLKIKQSGQVGIAVGLFSVFVVVLVIFVCLKISQFMITGAYVEDALAASNLASALIDIEEYGRSRSIRIAKPQAAYELYKEALAVNLQLDEDGRSFQRELLEGPVTVKSYIIYNVQGSQVEIVVFTDTGNMQAPVYGEAGQVYTPDGVLVETTSVYSKVAFGVKGLGQQMIRAEKEKSVDIKRNENE